jgi:hypothetical protein
LYFQGLATALVVAVVSLDLTYEHLGEKGTYSEYGPGWASISMTPLKFYAQSLSGDHNIRKDRF